MSFELMHFRDAEKILKKKKMLDDVLQTIEYVDSVLSGAYPYGSLLKQALAEKGWRDNGNLGILPGRKYAYLGCKKGIGVEGNLSVYEAIQFATFRLQLGFDKKKLDTGIILVNSIRGEKSPFGTTKELVEAEIELLEPTISLPLTVVLLDLI